MPDMESLAMEFAKIVAREPVPPEPKRGVEHERHAEYVRKNEERHAWAREVDPASYDEWASKSQNEREREFDGD